MKHNAIIEIVEKRTFRFIAVFFVMFIAAASASWTVWGDTTYFAEHDLSLGSLSLDHSCPCGGRPHRVYIGNGSGDKTKVNTTTTNKIHITGEHTIVLDDVKIDTANGCAFHIEKASSGVTSSVTLELLGTNSLKSGNEWAGLQVDSGSKLTISKGGVLTATGGDNGGAGIGGGCPYFSSGTIHIKDGTITATGGTGGAGIGSGYGGEFEEIKITGGNVDATGGDGMKTPAGTNGSAGIGCGSSGRGTILNSILIDANAIINAKGGSGTHEKLNYSGPGIGCDGSSALSITINLDGQNTSVSPVVEKLRAEGSSGINCGLGGKLATDRLPETPLLLKDISISASNSSKFNAIVEQTIMDSSNILHTTYNIYGTVALKKDFQSGQTPDTIKTEPYLAKDDAFVFCNNATLILPRDSDFVCAGTITNAKNSKGIFENADKLKILDSAVVTLSDFDRKAPLDFMDIKWIPKFDKFTTAESRTPYSGKNLATKENLYEINTRRENGIVVDTTKVELKAFDKAGNTVTEIVNCGTYSIQIIDKNLPPTTGTIVNMKLIVTQKSLTESMVPLKIAKQPYTGGFIKPLDTIKDSDTGKVLTPKNDYNVIYYNSDNSEKKPEDPIDTGKFHATISTKEGSNYSVTSEVTGNTIERDFEIVPLNINDTTITITPHALKLKADLEKNSSEYKNLNDEDKKTDEGVYPPGITSFVYTGYPQTADVKVKFKDSDDKDPGLTPGRDYTVAFLSDYPETPNKITKVGDKMTVTITPLEVGGNLTGAPRVETVTMEKRPLTIKQVSPVTDKKKYDGKSEISVTVNKDTDLSYIANKPETEIVSIEKVTAKAVKDDGTGKYVETSDAGEYTHVELSGISLAGYDRLNYRVDEPVIVPLSKRFEITPVEVPTPDLKAEYKGSSSGTSYDCTIKISNAAEGILYEYRMDDNKWQDSPTFTDIKIGSTHTFYAQGKVDADNKNYTPGKEGTTGPIKFDQITPEAPAAFTMTFTLNPDETTFTATIPQVQGAEYSFDGKTWSADNTKKDCQPATSYTGYIRMPETTLYKASPVTQSIGMSPKAAVKTPKITPNGGAFLTTRPVTIESETSGATIYYTIDGTEPTTASTKYTEGFTINKECTVKAIAVKPGMDDSKVASADFKKATASTKLQVRVTKSDGLAVSEGLEKTKYNTEDAITARLSRILTTKAGYTYLNIAYYDITIELSTDGEYWEPATVDNFPKEGVDITLEYPTGTGKDTHDFTVTHMFGETSKRLGITAGQTEQPSVKKAAEGLTFKVKGTSPVAIAWKASAAAASSSNNANAGTNAAGNNGTNTGNNAGANGNAAGNNGADGNNSYDANGDGSGANANGANGANGSGTGSDSATAGSDNSLTSRLASMLPQTGDTGSLLMWALIAAAALIVLLGIIVNRKRS